MQQNKEGTTQNLEIDAAASKHEHARSNNYQIQPPSKSMPDLDQRRGYEIAAAIRKLREAKGETVVGRKIGFTNRNIWPEYNIDASNWSYMYNSTIIDLSKRGGMVQDTSAEVDISHLSRLEPRIEPEIVLGLKHVPSAGMKDGEILDCIDWIAHGFEVVASIFPDWKFTAADTTAAFALHGLLLLGPRVHVQELAARPNETLDQLANFEISLYQNNELADQGAGSNVLGSPIQALRHLLELLEGDALNTPLSRGEVITTGTLTRALPIHDGDVWSTKLQGIDLPGLRIEFNVDGNGRPCGAEQ